MTNFNIRLLLAIAIWSVSTLTCQAQDQWSVWTGISARHRFSPKIQLSATIENRRKEWLNRQDQWMFQVEGNYTPTRDWRLTLGAMLQDIHGKPKMVGDYQCGCYWQDRPRIYTQAQYYLPNWGHLRFSVRARWQYTYYPSVEQTGVSQVDGSTAEICRTTGRGEHEVRGQLRIDYTNKSKFSPYVAAEYCFDHDLRMIRYNVGTSYRINKVHSLSFFFMRLDMKRSVDGNVLCARYNVNI